VWRPSRQYFIALIKTRGVWLRYGFAGTLLAINWLAFLWAVNNNAVLQASLGYYINPLLSVLLGVVVLGEKLARVHWCAIGVVTAGVAVMTVAGGGLPWVSLAMATSFSLYAFVKKGAQLPALTGLWFEMLILVPVSALYLFLQASEFAPSGQTSVVYGSTTDWWLLAGGGIITVLPLALFSSAAKTVSLSMMGILQYVGPTLQFLVGVLVYHELFSGGRVLGFALVWCGVLLYLAPSLRVMRRPLVVAKADIA
jgi:chloramphenicol-sensitive protein RarD